MITRLLSIYFGTIALMVAVVAIMGAFPLQV